MPEAHTIKRKTLFDFSCAMTSLLLQLSQIFDRLTEIVLDKAYIEHKS